MKWRCTNAAVGVLLSSFLFSFSASTLAADLGDATKLPPPATNTVDFARDIWPILDQSCLRCHAPTKPKSGFRLDSRVAALKGGEQGIAIIPGDSAKSSLIHFSARLVENMEMPPKGKGDPLTPGQIALLRAWVDQGANWAPVLSLPQTTASFTPGFRYITVSGNEQKFRELYGRNPGWSGGYEELEVHHRSGDNEVHLQARGILDESDYRVSLELRRQELGFIRGGAENSRKYYDDTGGYFPLLSTRFYSLTRDLHVDRGRAWVDLGLTLPDLPRFTLGYEYQWRRGTESLQQWGFGYKGFDPNFNLIQPFNIFPTSRDVDEQTHVVKAAVDYTVDGWSLENQFRGEFHDSKTVRANTVGFDLADTNKPAVVLVREHYRSFTGVNTFRVEKPFTSWLFASGGYLFSKLEGDSFFALDGQANGQTVPPTLFAWRAPLVVLERHSHVANLNTLLGPWQGFALTVGGQGEWSEQTGMGSFVQDQVTPPKTTNPAVASFTSLQTIRFKESAALRYSTIPFTTLFAEVNGEQEKTEQFERQLNPKVKAPLLLRDTEAPGHSLDWRAGFITSPRSWITFDAHFQQKFSDETFNHFRDTNNGIPPGDGYSAFIRARRTASEGMEARLTLRPVSWLRAILSYKLDTTDYHTTFDRVKSLGTNGAGGENFSGNYDANIYSASLLFTGVRNLQLTGTASYQDVSTFTIYSTNALVAPYGGGIYSVLAGATYYLGAKTDVSANYSLSWSDFSQNNFNIGIPFGIHYEQHTVQAMLQRRVTENLRVRVGYGFSRYSESTAGGFNDFTAHAIFGGLTYRFP